MKRNRRAPGATPPPDQKSDAPRRMFWQLVLAGGGVALLITIFVLAAGRRSGQVRVPPAAPASPGASTPTMDGVVPPSTNLLEPQQQVYAAYLGSEGCRECHPFQSEQWRHSHHGLAERAVDPSLDREAFSPGRSFTHGTQATTVDWSGARPEVVTPGLGGGRGPFPIDRVLGHEPLRQFLAAAPGGRWQTLEASFDPARREWFNVYGQEDRKPGEWGHWTGRGMNWNSMCADCHNTRVRKNYDPVSDSYQTAMVERSVGCESCHGPMKAHADWIRAHPSARDPDPTLRPMSRDQVFDTCGGCHARRSQLTGDFVPGDAFGDQYRLATVDETDLFYADGQVREEDYEYSAFLGSKMHAAGVRCVDCHDPHTARTVLPGNLLCLRCHDGSFAKAPIIIPEKHSHHAAESAGNQCIACHMPVTTYMQRHPRHDHGFTIPDPQLTKSLGIPNACNRCHADRPVEWAMGAVNDWYGARMDRHSRRRTQWVAAARAGAVGGREGMLSLLATNETPYWQAVAVQLIGRWVGDSSVRKALVAAAGHSNGLVRGAAIRALEPVVDVDPSIRQLVGRALEDGERGVRTAAAWALRTTTDPGSPAGRELVHLLSVQGDQPAGQMQLGSYQMARGRPEIALQHYQKAVEWDPGSPPFRHELAVALSMNGRVTEAVRELTEAVRLDPGEAEYRYKLGLALAETGNLAGAAGALQEAVRLAPQHASAWYNLGLARNGLGDLRAAIETLRQGEGAAPMDPRLPYARATIHARLGELEAAREAVRRTLAIQPGHAEATALWQQLPQP